MKLEVKNLYKFFGKKRVIEDLSFELMPGEITGLVGRNGAGKTSLMQVMAHIYKANKGQVFLDGRDLEKDSHLQGLIVYLPDNFNYFDSMSLDRAMGYYEIAYDSFDKKFCLREWDKLGLKKSTKLKDLSKGNKTLAGLIFSLATGARFLLLDEVLDGVDVLNRKHVYSYLIEAASSGKSIFLSSHELEDLQGLSTRVVYLGLDGGNKVMSLDQENDIKKYQLVTRTGLPPRLREGTVERFSIGRVHTLLMEGSREDWERIFQEEGIVQYDPLALTIEDLFYWEEGRRTESERSYKMS